MRSLCPPHIHLPIYVNHCEILVIFFHIIVLEEFIFISRRFGGGGGGGDASPISGQIRTVVTLVASAENLP